MFEGERYDLLQFHFHIPSEHTFDGKHSDIEIHFVHQHIRNKDLLVIGHCFQDGYAHLFIEDITGIPVLKTNQKTSVNVEFDSMNFATEYIHYDGSLTTPPCTEGVSWFVSKEISTIHK